MPSCLSHSNATTASRPCLLYWEIHSKDCRFFANTVWQKSDLREKAKGSNSCFLGGSAAICGKKLSAANGFVDVPITCSWVIFLTLLLVQTPSSFLLMSSSLSSDQLISNSFSLSLIS